jgi:hypothetical protein
MGWLRQNPEVAGTEPLSRRTPTLAITSILFVSVLLKLFFIWYVDWYVDGRAYYDVFNAINFGYLIHQKIFSIQINLANNKTFLGPILWFYLYQGFGILGLKLLTC